MILVTAGGVVVEPPAPQPQPDAPTPVVEHSYLVELIGHDGMVWDLNAGPVQALVGTTLFDSPAVNHWMRTSPALDGSRWTGMRTEAREIGLPVEVLGRDWADWRAVDTAFFRSVSPDAECVLRVTAPDGVTRSMPVRFVSDGESGVDEDPLLRHRRAYELEFVAASPFWRGTPVSKSFSVNPPEPFYSATRTSGLFVISQSATTNIAKITNPGDVPAWPIYTVQGPATSWRVGINGQVVASNVALTNTGSIIVDSNPHARSIVNQNGSRVYENMSEVNFQPIPPGEDIELDLAVNGFGASSLITVGFTPLYRRPL